MSSLASKQGPRYRHAADDSEPYETIAVEKLTPIIGAEISGVDIGKLVSDFVATLCLGWRNVTPCGARVRFSISHYITVSSPSGGVGGRWSTSFSALRTRRASGQPPAIPRRSG